MQKTKIVLLAAGILLLAGCGNKAADNQNKNQEQAQTQEEAQNAKSGVISSIKEAMGLGKTMRCTYKIQSEEGESEMISYVKGETYMTEMNIEGIAQKSIFNAQGMYSWSEKEKKGTKMSKKCMEEMAATFPEDESANIPEAPDPTGEKAFEDALDVKCEEAADVDFSIPADVDFVDQCEMKKKMMDNLRTMNTSGAGAGNGVGAGNMPNIPNMPKVNLP